MYISSPPFTCPGFIPSLVVKDMNYGEGWVNTLYARFVPPVEYVSVAEGDIKGVRALCKTSQCSNCMYNGGRSCQPGMNFGRER